jgi:hypothetical protein
MIQIIYHIFQYARAVPAAPGPGADKGVTTCWCSLNGSTALRADGRR